MSISLVRDNPLSIQAGATAVISATSNLAVSDSDYPDASITYTVTTGPTNGALLKSGVAVSSFTQADLDNGLISYHETSLSPSVSGDSFFFRASDPAGNQTPNTLFQINITPPPPPDNPVRLSTPGHFTVYA